MNSKYYQMKEKKRCVHCGKQDERTLEGRIACRECAERENEWQKNKRGSLSPEEREIFLAKRRAAANARYRRKAYEKYRKAPDAKAPSAG